MEVLQHIARRHFATERCTAQSVTGGDINQALRVDFDGTRCFVKVNPTAPPGFFQAEARGLALLRSARVCRVPQVLYVAEAEAPYPAYLVLEWLQPGAGMIDFPVQFGRIIASLHQLHAAAYGLDQDNFIGLLPQANGLLADWIPFYRERRLLPQITLARAQGLLSPERERRLEQVMARLDRWLDGIPRQPSLLHGDLWAGNYMIVDHHPALIDPAVYYGDREIELAFIELFGGFPAGFMAAYAEAYPIEAGYADRRALYQLYPLLVHLNLFGAAYANQVDAVCKRYVG